MQGHAVWVGTRSGYILLLDGTVLENCKQEAALRGIQYCGEGRVRSIVPFPDELKVNNSIFFSFPLFDLVFFPLPLPRRFFAVWNTRTRFPVVWWLGITNLCHRHGNPLTPLPTHGWPLLVDQLAKSLRFFNYIYRYIYIYVNVRNLLMYVSFWNQWIWQKMKSDTYSHCGHECNWCEDTFCCGFAQSKV